MIIFNGETTFMNNITLFFQLFIAATAGLFTDSNIDIKRIATQCPPQHIVSKLQQFEASFTYPFSNNEEFTIKHGISGDYFAFFKRLGKPYYYTVTSLKNETGQFSMLL